SPPIATAQRPATPDQRSVLVRVRQQREIPRPLDRGRELALVRCAGPGDAARDDLARLRDIGLQGREILVVDLLDAFRREPAKLLAAKITCHVPSPRSPARSGRLFGFRAALSALGALGRRGVAPLAAAGFFRIAASAARALLRLAGLVLFLRLRH